MLEEYIKPQLKRYSVKPLEGGRESADQAGVRLASACCVLYLVHSYGLRVEESDRDLLVSALLLRVDKNTEKCLDYASLIEWHFPSDNWRMYEYSIELVVSMIQVLPQFMLYNFDSYHFGTLNNV